MGRGSRQRRKEKRAEWLKDADAVFFPISRKIVINWDELSDTSTSYIISIYAHEYIHYLQWILYYHKHQDKWDYDHHELIEKQADFVERVVYAVLSFFTWERR